MAIESVGGRHDSVVAWVPSSGHLSPGGIEHLFWPAEGGAHCVDAKMARVLTAGMLLARGFLEAETEGVLRGEVSHAIAVRVCLAIPVMGSLALLQRTSQNTASKWVYKFTGMLEVDT